MWVPAAQALRRRHSGNVGQGAGKDSQDAADIKLGIVTGDLALDSTGCNAAVETINRTVAPVFEIVRQLDFLKVCSRTARTRIFLVLSFVGIHKGQIGFRLIKHRTPLLTSAYEGKLVSADWLIKFCCANAAEASAAIEVTWENIPEDCEVLKRSALKVVVRDKYGSVITLWKDGVPQVEPQHYDGTATRCWERHTIGVTNWYYDSNRY